MGLTFRQVAESDDRLIPVPVSRLGFEPMPLVASLTLTRYSDSGLADVSVHLDRPGKSTDGGMPCHSLLLLKETGLAAARQFYRAIRQDLERGRFMFVLRADGVLRLRVGTRRCFGPRPGF